MEFKLIGCDVLTREVCYCIARCPHAVSPVFLPKGEHNVPERLRERLQAEVDAVAAGEVAYDAVLLGYGLCGNATLGLTARTCPLVIPRAHDCTTLFLGSKAAFIEHFGDNPSQCWASVGYSERGDSILSDASTREHLAGAGSYEALAEQYGEENARYLMDALSTQHGSNEIVLLDVPETRVPEVLERIRREAEATGLQVRTLTGSIRLIEKLLSGDWPSGEFLVVPPGQRVAGVYDMDQVITAEPASD